MPNNEPSKVKSSSQGAFVIWHGMKLSGLLRLIRKGPSLDWSRWPQIALLPGFATYNSIMGGLESLAYGRRLRETKIEHPPVFILGFWRSGTTLLHNLITRDPQFTYATTYECLFPWHFLLTENVAVPLTGFLLPKTRPMDNVPSSWDAPQEDDIALCTMSLVSPYLMLAMQQERSTYEEVFDLNGLSPADLKLWKDSLDLLMRKITLRHNKPIVLKSPSHTFRVKTLVEMYPDAKFIYIYRNPYSVFRSTVHLRETMIRENGLSAPRPLDHRNEVIHFFNKAFDIYERERHLIPEGNLHEVRFEDLESDPLGEMQNCYEQLGLGNFDTLRSMIEPEIPQLQRYRKNSFESDPVWMRAVYDQCREAFDRFGYPSPLEEVDVVAA